MCDFLVITLFDFGSLCDNGVRSRSCSFALDDVFFPATQRVKRFLNCVCVRLLPMRPKDHMQKISYLTRSPCCSWGERQNLEDMRMLPMGPRNYIPERTISSQL